ncbi:hypothetical protein LTR10_021842 [Elasticomyces elasticus]|uniref:Xylanolytic transcriptional activator regulatory domain-containing protein n=1 Tax=Exophiala sideris TaxID=1016849 RepID=A0ABR0JFZ3_9EURO|nr:hypothetical protein LTR10_021842 [Elasticomyces elasticus]KAK5025274.1 hypothetical protein LTS07_008125 [Exophiala sideris]KAK5029177.1 hypothetical protein LTR13_008714 [Exophiala sideris]KAK5063334.1 hypothetical protein LTR69_004040 [Exophiala sideris]KAK5179049.1 hypothetical protein LTR44_008538 [Eurotiomycetes sp. CCFEE 6388]
MRCDRRVPCSNCVRRHRVEFCKEAPASITTTSRGEPNLQTEQEQESAQGQQLQISSQNQVDNGQVLPTFCDAFGSHQDLQQGQNSHQHKVLQPQFNTQAPVLPQAPEGSHGHLTLRGNIDDDEPVGSYGTLMLNKDGRSKYLGPTAGSEWLKDSETREALDTEPATRAPSPETPVGASALSQPIPVVIPSVFPSITTPVAFPFNASPARVSTRELVGHLPPKGEAWTLVEAYYRYCAWHHDVAPKASFEKTFDRVYTLKGSLSTPVSPQELALVFIIMAQGTMYNVFETDNPQIEMPSHDPSAEEWLHLSERALIKGNFLSNNTVAGLQTLYLMGHMHLESDNNRRGDSAWSLWGLVMRLAQAMGMHRDGTRWNLSQDVIEERRKVFWECNAADVFQAHCFSRPCAINPEHCDTAFPSDLDNLNGEKSYFTLRFELSQLSSEILAMAMKVRKAPYSEVTKLDLKLSDFERNLPFSIRCRAALLSMPSRYPQPEAAIEASPEPSRTSMAFSFQQMNLALNISETIINLHRPYYAKALYDEIKDPVKSMYAPSFLTVVERCAVILAIVNDIHMRFPAVSVRQWNFWFHVYNSALCLGTLVLRNPGNAMATFAFEQIDAAICLFTSLTHHGGRTPHYQRNLQWLQKLRARASSKISAISTAQKDGLSQNDGLAQRTGSEDREDAEDIELLGWRTRLIERAGQGRPTVSTIRLLATPTGSQVTTDSRPPVNQDYVASQGQQGTTETIMPGAMLSFTTSDPTDDLVR